MRWFRDRLFLHRVLREVNALRTSAGLPSLNRIPRGRVRAADSCPLVHALEARSVYARVIGGRVAASLDKSYGSRITPPLLFEFAQRFDAGDFPHLIERNI